jgi:hypothetical protein
MKRYVPVKFFILGFLIFYGLVMSTIVGIEIYVKNHSYALIKLIMKSFKLLADIFIHLLFITLLNFFVKFKISNQDDGGHKRDRNGGLTKRNKLVIAWIIFLYILSLINVTFVFSQGIILYFDPSLSADGTFVDRLFNFVALLIYPVKDFLIAISLAILYLHQDIN